MSTPPKPEASSRGVKALHAFQEAARLEALPAFQRLDAHRNRLQADRIRAEGSELLKPTGTLVVGPGEVATRAADGTLPADPVDTSFCDTLQHPNTISVEASARRMEAALHLGVLESSVDAAVSVGASNSIEKMLCYQMAAAHDVAMKLLRHSDEAGLPSVEVARLTNAAARMMEVYQTACVTLQKLKSRGTQRVLVQYQQVNVAEGGQAVVAGRVSGGSRRGRQRKIG